MSRDFGWTLLEWMLATPAKVELRRVLGAELGTAVVVSDHGARLPVCGMPVSTVVSHFP